MLVSAPHSVLCNPKREVLRIQDRNSQAQGLCVPGAMGPVFQAYCPG